MSQSLSGDAWFKGGKGYKGLGGSKPSLALVFDTYNEGSAPGAHARAGLFLDGDLDKTCNAPLSTSCRAGELVATTLPVQPSQNRALVYTARTLNAPGFRIGSLSYR